MPRTRDVEIRGLRFYVWRLRRSRLRREFHSRVASQVASVYRGGWAIDVGCGPGYLEGLLASRLLDARVIGLDVNRRMLSLARSAGVIDVVQAKSSGLPFRNGRIDLIVSTASLKDWADPLKGLTEMLRVLSPDGTALVYEFITVGPAARPRGFAQRFGLVSDLLRRAARFAAPFRLQDAYQLASALPHHAGVLVRTEADLGVVRLMIRRRTNAGDLGTANLE